MPKPAILLLLSLVLTASLAIADRGPRTAVNAWSDGRPSVYPLPHPLTPLPSVVPWWWPGPCNRPASDVPPAPDGCPDYAPVAPPQAPIPPACVSDAHVEEWQEDGQPVTELFVTVDHPELCGPYDCPGTIHLTRHGDGPWEWIDISADVSCAKDEGPLAWATLEILNYALSETTLMSPGEGSSRLDALGIYTAPLPSPYLDLLAQLGGWQWHRVYLPIIEGEDQ